MTTDSGGGVPPCGGGYTDPERRSGFLLKAVRCSMRALADRITAEKLTGILLGGVIGYRRDWCWGCDGRRLGGPNVSRDPGVLCSFFSRSLGRWQNSGRGDITISSCRPFCRFNCSTSLRLTYTCKEWNRALTIPFIGGGKTLV
jgi:hypothetical protein